MMVKRSRLWKPRSTKKVLLESRSWASGRISTGNEDEGKGSLKSKDAETGKLNTSREHSVV